MEAKPIGRIEALVTLTLTEEQAAALADLSAFGGKAVVEHLGKLSPAYQRDYGKAMTRLIDDLRTEVAPVLKRIQNARDVYEGRKFLSE